MRILIIVNEYSHIWYNLDMKKSKFGEILKNLRTEKNLTQGELAKVLGCSQSMLTRWENGECEPTAPYIMAVADFFAVSADFLLGRKEY